MKTLYSIAAVARNAVRTNANHFRKNVSLSDARALFREHVELIEVETTSYCNRTCSFCPNQFIDRRSERHPMPDATWEAIVAGLREVEYDGTFVWSRYSEPLSEERLTDRIREVRTAAPRARIGVNSNGDYLNREYLDMLADAGLNRLWVDIYFPDGEQYSLDTAREYLRKFLGRVDKRARVVGEVPELHAKLQYDRVEVTTHCRNVASMRMTDMSDRGDLIPLARPTIRTSPCYAPFKHLVIDWDGSVVPCCQLRSDSEKHAPTVVGRIGQDRCGLVGAYIRLADWRRGLRAFGPKAPPCRTCNVSEYADTRLTRTLSALLSSESVRSRALRAALQPLLRRKRRY